MFRDTITVYRKEIKSILKDKTILFMCILLPFIFMFGEGKMMTMMTDGESSEKTYTAYMVNAPENMKEGLSSLGFKDAALSTEDYIEEIKNKKADMLLVFPSDFTVEVEEGKEMSDIEVYYNSSSNDSLMLREKLSAYLDSFRPVVFTVNANAEKTYDLGDKTFQAKNMIASMVPGFLVFTIVYGIMVLASNIIAGDKETGFLNTVLITPVSRSF